MRARRLPFRKRTLRLWLGAIVFVCLLVNQWAVAAYACPSEQAKLQCHHHHVDKQHPGLCQQHCNPVPFSDVDGKTPTVPPALVPPLPPASDLFVSAAEPRQHEHDLYGVMAAAPPPIHRYCRYLI